MLKENYDVTLQFLRFIYPIGPWMLTAISVDKKTITASTFQKDEEGKVRAWLETHKNKNLYYSVNEPIKAAYEKPKLQKTDVHRVHFLHVDLDPRAGEDVESEQARILGELENYNIPPSVVVFSGGGYNALWRLDESIAIGDSAASESEALSRAVDVERRNWQLELDFNTPDHCRDISRILRLPGTINRPDAKKISKGRVPALAKIHNIDAESWPYEGFMATPHVSANKPSNSEVTVEAVKVDNLDALKISEKLKVLIAQGRDPDSEKAYESRSEILWNVCCEMVRQGLDDGLILGIITDSRYGISTSVLDKGSGTMRYAHRQVSRARDYAEDPLLAEMNDQFAVILSYGHQTAIMVEEGQVNIETGQSEPIFQNFQHFKNRIKNYKKIQITEKKKISAFDWWTSHERRREYLDVTFAPGMDTPNRFNLWRGFAVEPKTGDSHQSLLDHMFENVCSDNQEYYDYLIRWMARVVQQPRTSSMVAPVLLGDRGTGKSIFCNYFGALFEPHTHTVSDTNALTGKFNAHLGQCVFVLAEEAFDIRDKRHESVLKEHITGRTISIERKGLDRIQMPNYAHLIMTSNNERVVPAGDHERRFFVLRIGNKRRQDSEYFRRILKDQSEGGLENLLHHLLSIDLTEYDVTRVPHTKELREQQEFNISLEADWLLEKLETGQWLPNTNWRGPVIKQALHEDYQNYHQAMNARTRVRGVRSFHKFIVQQIPGTVDRQIYLTNAGQKTRPMVFEFPDLDVCRKRFDEVHGWKTDWPSVDEEERKGEVVEFSKNPFE